MSFEKKLVILHGWTYSTEKWQPFIKLLEQFSQVSFLKVPGLTEALVEVWSLEDYVEWLDKKLKPEKSVIILGHSNGGRIALAYARAHPEKIESLILLNSAGIRDKRWRSRLKRGLFGSVAKLGKRVVPLSNFRFLLYKLAREQDYYCAPEHLRQTMANLISVDLESQLDQIKIKTLLIWGAQDQMTPLKDGQTMHRLLPDSQLKIISSARHSPMYSHTKEVVSIIRDFI